MECLIAAALAALILPTVTSFFSNSLETALELRLRGEAMNAALSCLDAAEAQGAPPTQRWIEENVAGALAQARISMEVVEDDGVRTWRVCVRWSERGGEREIRLVRSAP
ncbi:MAG: hypothetical protein ACOYD9_04025 [Pyramidobacter sp.]